jgi:hypothetical protein
MNRSDGLPGWLWRVAALASAVAVGVALVVPAAAAQQAPTGTIIGPASCVDYERARAAVGSDGVVRGFASGYRCGDQRIHYFERAGAGWRAVLTPYSGWVIAVAQDRTGTYLLYELERGPGDAGLGEVWITKRTAAGTFTAGRRLSKGPSVGHVLGDLRGDVHATGGAWWAVWTEQVTYSLENARFNLYQAKTIGTDILGKRRVTGVSGVSDIQPTLAPLSTSTAMLVWSRRRPGTSQRELYRAFASSASGAWTGGGVVPVGQTGANDYSPDLAVKGSTAWLTWLHGREIRVVRRGATGAWSQLTTLGTNGDVVPYEYPNPTVAIAAVDEPVVSWTHVPDPFTGDNFWRVRVGLRGVDGHWTLAERPMGGDPMPFWLNERVLVSPSGRITFILRSPSTLNGVGTDGLRML